VGIEQQYIETRPGLSRWQLANGSEGPPVVSVILRFDFQIEMCDRFKGTILNVGCNEDAGRLQERFGRRVINCDMEAWDAHMQRGNPVDRIFNALDFPWPFANSEAELVVLGDILEHFPPDVMVEALRESARVAPNVCVTVPEDTRIDEAKQQAAWIRENYNLHTTICTKEIMADVFDQAGFNIDIFQTGEWGFDDILGHCILGKRR
jgi:hypothetical protein